MRNVAPSIVVPAGREKNGGIAYGIYRSGLHSEWRPLCEALRSSSVKIVNAPGAVKWRQ
ncbi:hypothetical protein KCP73_22360 [Salmonella enterica subsp. enterica]|nr:hypothetical protein KCP73_22360 [Salmonella enterica subsp. enterica]